jgi:hypothetical protein
MLMNIKNRTAWVYTVRPVMWLRRVKPGGKESEDESGGYEREIVWQRKSSGADWRVRSGGSSELTRGERMGRAGGCGYRAEDGEEFRGIGIGRARGAQLRAGGAILAGSGGQTCV